MMPRSILGSDIESPALMLRREAAHKGREPSRVENEDRFP